MVLKEPWDPGRSGGKGPVQRLAVSPKSGGSEVLCEGVGEAGRDEPGILRDPAGLAVRDALAPYQRARPP